MENNHKYPHISPEMAQTLQEIAASPEQWQSSDAAAKSQIDTTVTRYQLEPGNMTRSQLEPRNATIVVIGTSGAGKSATANTLLGKKVFKEGGSAVAMTTDFQVEKTDVGGIQLTVVDTPGTWNTKIPTKAGFAVDDIFYIIVVNLASPRFGQAELDLLRTLKGHDRRAVLTPDRCMVVLTHADSALQQHSLKQYVAEIKGDPLHELLTEHVNGKVLAINNSPTTEYEQTLHRQEMLRNTMESMKKKTPPVTLTNHLQAMLIYTMEALKSGLLMLICVLWMIIKTFVWAACSILILLCMFIITFVLAACSNLIGALIRKAESIVWPKEDKTIKRG